MRSIVEQIFNFATTTPDKIAITNGKQIFTFSELKVKILQAKAILENKYKVKSGDMIIISADKQLMFSPVYFACHLLSAVAIPISPDTNNKRFMFIYTKTSPKLVVDYKCDDLEYNRVELKEFELENTQNLIINYSFPLMDDLADIIFTTGTTGEPKGVKLSHKNISAAALNINTFIKNTEDDVELLALPISHSFGLGRLRCALNNGQTVVLLGSFANIKRFFRFIEEYNVSGFGMVPASWGLIKKFSGNKIGNYLNQLRYIEIGSAPMNEKDKRLLMDLLPTTRICMHYGLTEASRSCFLEFHESKDYLDTVGKSSPNMDVKIFDEKGNEVEENIEGEICVKGDAVTQGYLLLNDCDRESFYDEYFRTGDWGILCSGGWVKLCSRKKELINVGGKKVSPIEVEDVINSIECVKESVCVGIDDPDGIMGEVVKVYIVTDEPDLIDISIIREACEGKIEEYKIPVDYEIIDEIPKTSSGKVQRLVLKGS